MDWFVSRLTLSACWISFDPVLFLTWPAVLVGFMDEVLALISFNPVLHADLCGCPIRTVVVSESCALMVSAAADLHPELPFSTPERWRSLCSSLIALVFA